MMIIGKTYKRMRKKVNRREMNSTRFCFFFILFSILEFNEFSVALKERRSVKNVNSFVNKNVRKRRDAPLEAGKLGEDAYVCTKFQDTSNVNYKKFVNEIHLSGEKPVLQVTRTGSDLENILLVMSDNGNSTVLLSNEIHTFENISNRLNGDITKNVQLTVIKHPSKPEIVYLAATNLNDLANTTLYISKDSSTTFSKVFLPFSLHVSTGFIFHRERPEYFMAFDSMDKNLYLTKDMGLNWTTIASHVVTAKWSQNEKNLDDIFIVTNESPGEILFGLLLQSSNPLKNVLRKSSNMGKTWNVLKDHIYSFGIEREFLYASVYLYPKSDRELLVSTDNGIFWNRVRLPDVTEDRFYSILDLSEGLIFLHVDDPGDTGRGVLYISDATGIFFSESMRDHLFPNAEDLTDFYSVKSMHGVFITSQLLKDNSLRSMITFNRGVEWQPIRRPEGAPCANESNLCHLQIHNLYSMERGIKTNPPLSVPNAKGIILAHGHVADSLQTSDPDVYVSRDGGYIWNFALKGPHHYQIADHGGLLVAVPSDTPSPKVIKFSANAGRCWVEYNFTIENIVFTGLLIEPGNKDSSVALWGYSQSDKTWHTFIFNFSSVVNNRCEEDNFEEWTSHSHDGSECALGRKETNFRLKPNSWCLIGRTNEHVSKVENCSCTKEDYGCDYGYIKTNEVCIKDSTVEEINICLRNHQEKLVPLGYHKIPGDTCAGGFAPREAQLIDLNIVCTDDVYLKKDAIKDDQLTKVMESLKNSRNSRVAWVLFLVVCVGVVIVISVVTARRFNYKYRNVVFKYSSIKADDDDDFDAKINGGHGINTNTSVYDDISSDEENPPQQTGKSFDSNTPSSNLTPDGLPHAGYLHPKLFELMNTKHQNKALLDSDEELLE